MRHRRLLLVALLAVLASLLSGCFSVRTFYWSKKVPTVSGSSNAILNLRPYDNTADSGYPFVLVGFDSGDPLTFGSLRTWDAAGNFDGPKTMVKDNTLRNYILNNSLCTFSGIDAASLSGKVWTLFRAPDSVSYSTNKAIRNAQVKLRINVGSSASSGDVYSTAFFSGEWNDNGDAVPNGSDTMGCTGAIFTTLPVG